ncbi:hypothetical protein MMC06_003839 [Schaereria dolodes]|nr:hypothetical protein [Schaereria dolodes]
MSFWVSSEGYYYRPTQPDFAGCGRSYGFPLDSQKCMAAWNNLPVGTESTFLVTKAQSTASWIVEVPKVYLDNSERPGCVITIDLDGDSQTDDTFEISWTVIRGMAKYVIDGCVSRERSEGGLVTYGLERTTQAIAFPVMRNGSAIPGISSGPVVVENPQGFEVGIPETPVVVLSDIISSPQIVQPKKNRDWRTSLNVKERLVQLWTRTSHRNIKDIIWRSITGLENNSENLLLPEHEGRWWEFPLALTTSPQPDINYRCNVTLGSPSIDSCQAALYQFSQRGQVDLDPTGGPILKIAGNCAIVVQANEKYTTTWATLQNVAEALLATCITGPVTGASGGTASSQSSAAGKTQNPNPYNITVYFQDTFSGAPNTTCAWEVVSSRQGDVRNCSAQDPLTPPLEPLLGLNLTADGLVSTDLGLSAKAECLCKYKHLRKRVL